jgi:hypothetical protein
MAKTKSVDYQILPHDGESKVSNKKSLPNKWQASTLV